MCVKEIHGRAQLHSTQDFPGSKAQKLRDDSRSQRKRLVFSNLLLRRKNMMGRKKIANEKKYVSAVDDHHSYT